MEPNPATSRFSKGDRWFLGALLVAGVIIGLRGILRLGYIGQDFDGIQGHNHLIRTFPETYTYALTNPPGLYWFGNLIFRHLTTVYYLEILAAFFLLINLGGVWLLFGLLWEMIGSPHLRYAAAALIVFIPFRTVHAVVIAGDAFAIPFFAGIAVLALRLFKNPRDGAAWVLLSLGLSCAMLFKYTFVGLLPPLALVLLIRLVREVPREMRKRWVAVGALALAVPSAAFLLQMHASSQVSGTTTSGHWKAKGDASDMRWSNLLTLQRNDVKIFSAPGYFRDEINYSKRYSYPALVHLASFSDCQDLFQKPPPSISSSWRQRSNAGFLRDRRPSAQRFTRFAIAWCIPFSLLAIVGTAGCGILTLQALASPHRARLTPATIVVTALAAGFYSPIFFSLPWLVDPYTAGYWLPRLVLPALLSFFALGFVFLDLAVGQAARFRHFAKTLGRLCLAYTAVACFLFAGFLF